MAKTLLEQLKLVKSAVCMVSVENKILDGGENMFFHQYEWPTSD